MFDRLISLIAPHHCIQCSVEGELWCAACRNQALSAIERCYRCRRLSPNGQTCQSCRRTSALFAVHVATPYDAAAKRLVWKLKFEGAQAAARIMAPMMAERLLCGAKQPLVVPVPTASSRARRRGYDQSRLLARELAKSIDLPLVYCLVRQGQQQQRLASRQRRLVQLGGAFRMGWMGEVRAAEVLLVDDVITTGATLEAAAKTLKDAGAKRVSAIVFAQA